MKYQKYELKLQPVCVREDVEKYQIAGSGDIAEFCRNIIDIHNFPEERVYIIMLNNNGNIVGFNEVSKGSLSEAPIHPRDVFKTAIMMNASALIVAHNHPSTNPKPSYCDIEATKRLCEAGDILGIDVCDHVIVCEKEHCSMRALGYVN